jgi:hypothetical protein
LGFAIVIHRLVATGKKMLGSLRTTGWHRSACLPAVDWHFFRDVPGGVTNGRVLCAGIKNGALVAPWGGPARWHGQVGIE